MIGHQSDLMIGHLSEIGNLTDKYAAVGNLTVTNRQTLSITIWMKLFIGHLTYNAIGQLTDNAIGHLTDNAIGHLTDNAIGHLTDNAIGHLYR